MVMLDFFIICEIGVSRFTLPFNVKSGNSGQLSLLTNVVKQTFKEKLIIDDKILDNKEVKKIKGMSLVSFIDNFAQISFNQNYQLGWHNISKSK